MPALKRKSDGAAGVASKRAKASAEVHYTQEELNEMSKEDLVAHALQLQSQLAAAPREKELSKEEIDEKATKARVILVKGIEKLMTWKPSCKTGSAMFAYEGHVHNEMVFKRMLNLPESHSKKMFKISLDDFDNTVGLPTKSIRYDYLVIKGTDVNVRWNAEDNTSKVSGKYGK